MNHELESVFFNHKRKITQVWKNVAVVWGLTIEIQILVWYFLHKIWPKQIKIFYCCFALGNLIKLASVTATSVRRIFERGVGAGNLRIMKTKRKISPLRISPFSFPKLVEDQKKGLHSDLVRALAQNMVNTKKKKKNE